MIIKSIKTNADYKKALSRLERIFDTELNTAEGQEADKLSSLIEEYENIHYPIEPPDTTEVIMRREKELLEGKVKTKTWGEIKKGLGRKVKNQKLS